MEHGHTIDSMSAASYGSPERAPTILQEIIGELDASAAAATGGGYAAQEVTSAARRICAVARRDGLYIEQAIVKVKEAWRATPGRAKPRSGSSDAVLDQLVSACIREFYTER